MEPWLPSSVRMRSRRHSGFEVAPSATSLGINIQMHRNSVKVAIYSAGQNSTTGYLRCKIGCVDHYTTPRIHRTHGCRARSSRRPACHAELHVARRTGGLHQRPPRRAGRHSRGSPTHLRRQRRTCVAARPGAQKKKAPRGGLKLCVTRPSGGKRPGSRSPFNTLRRERFPTVQFCPLPLPRPSSGRRLLPATSADDSPVRPAADDRRMARIRNTVGGRPHGRNRERDIRNTVGGRPHGRNRVRDSGRRSGRVHGARPFDRRLLAEPHRPHSRCRGPCGRCSPERDSLPMRLRADWG